MGKNQRDSLDHVNLNKSYRRQYFHISTFEELCSWMPGVKYLLY